MDMCGLVICVGSDILYCILYNSAHILIILRLCEGGKIIPSGSWENCGQTFLATVD